MSFLRRGPRTGRLCRSCGGFSRRDLIGRMDDCVTALEAAAASFALVQPVGAATDDWDRVRAVEDRFTALRSQIDDLALAALALTECCEDGDEGGAGDAGAAGAKAGAPARRR